MPLFEVKCVLRDPESLKETRAGFLGSGSLLHEENFHGAAYKIVFPPGYEMRVLCGGGVGACSISTLEGLSSLHTLHIERWDDFVATLLSLKDPYRYNSKRFLFTTTYDQRNDYIQYPSFKKLIESSKLLESFTNLAHPSSTNHLYMFTP